MKRYVLPFAVMIFITNLDCRKTGWGDNTLNATVEKKIIVTTIAGDGSPGFANGFSLTARFHTPCDVAVGIDGTLYVTDAENHRIRRIMGSQVSTFAGNDTSRILNGTGTTAEYIYPYSIAFDGNGNLYTSDQMDSRLRKISPTSQVTTFAGTAIDGFADGNADRAMFVFVQGLATDIHGDMLIADTYNQRIRKISSTGVATIAGATSAGHINGNGTTARFNFPSGVAIDKQGNLFIPDQYNFCIRKITPAGEVSTFAGSGVFGDHDGSAAEAKFKFPVDIVIDAQDNLYVADVNCIRKITPQGTVSTIAGASAAGYKDGDGAEARFFNPLGLGIDAQGNIYVADTFNNRIRKISFE